MRRVLFITNSISFGGAAKMLCFVAESLVARGHEVVIVNLRATENVTEYERTIAGAEIVTFDAVPNGKNRHIYRISKIKKIAKDKHSDVVISFTTFPNMYASVVGKLLHIRTQGFDLIYDRRDPLQFAGTVGAEKLFRYFHVYTLLNVLYAFFNRLTSEPFRLLNSYRFLHTLSFYHLLGN